MPNISEIINIVFTHLFLNFVRIIKDTETPTSGLQYILQQGFEHSSQLLLWLCSFEDAEIEIDDFKPIALQHFKDLTENYCKPVHMYEIARSLNLYLTIYHAHRLPMKTVNTLVNMDMEALTDAVAKCTRERNLLHSSEKGTVH